MHFKTRRRRGGEHFFNSLNQVVNETLVREGERGLNTDVKSRKALHAISLIKRYFNKNELLLLVTSNYYSILYYNSEIWHIPCLSLNLKKPFLSIGSSTKNLCKKQWFNHFIQKLTPNYKQIRTKQYYAIQTFNLTTQNVKQPNSLLGFYYTIL